MVVLAITLRILWQDVPSTQQVDMVQLYQQTTIIFAQLQVLKAWLRLRKILNEENIFILSKWKFIMKQQN